MKKKSFFDGGIGVGGASLLSVFVILCLTTFAALSLISANADLRLARKAAQATADYYAADAKAQQLLAALDLAADGVSDPAELLQRAASLPGVTAAKDEAGMLLVEFSFSIDENRVLSGSADLTETPSGKPPRLLSCRTQRVSTEAPADASLPVWIPEQ